MRCLPCYQFAQCLRICQFSSIVQVDISQEAEVQRMVARACEEFGTIHILVNNAARFVFNFVTDITEEGNSAPLRRSTTSLQLQLYRLVCIMLSAVTAAGILS